MALVIAKFFFNQLRHFDHCEKIQIIFCGKEKMRKLCQISAEALKTQQKY